jgi:predicted transcriptional regulator
MEKKGLVAHRRQGQGYIYRPVVQQQRVLGSVVRQLLRNVFGGSPAVALQYFIAEGACTTDEIDQLRRLIDQADERKKRPRGKGESP